MSLTTDPSDPRLGHGVDEAPVPQNETYLVLRKGLRAADPCRSQCRMCCRCQMHKPVGEFIWTLDGDGVGT